MKKLIISLALMLGLVTGANAKTVVDVMDFDNWDFYGLDFESYSDLHGVTCVSPAVWSLNIHGNGMLRCIVFRGMENSGMATTRSGGVLKKITMTWGTPSTDSYTTREMQFFGKTFEEGPYTYQGELYDAATAGTMFATRTYNKGQSNLTVTVTPDKEYEYLGIRTKELGTFIKQIKLEWDVPEVQTETPVFSVTPGEHYGPQEVAITCPTPGARIYYTLDGSDPAKVDNTPLLYTGPITVNRSAIIRAFATSSKRLISETVGAGYHIVNPSEWNRLTDISTLPDGACAIITAADSGWAMSTTQNKNNRAQAAIEKSADGSIAYNPQDDVQVCKMVKNDDGTWSFDVGAGYLMAVAESNYLRTSGTITDEAKATVTLTDGVLDIYFAAANRHLRYNDNSQLFGCYASGQQDVALYVMDGTETPLSVSAPILSVASGTFTSPITISMMCATQGAKIYYTTDGSTPNATSQLYEGAFTLSTDCTVKAIAVCAPYVSSVSEATYTFGELPAISLAEAYALPDGSTFKMGSDLVVTYTSGNYNYVYDASANTEAWGLIYAANLGLEEGQLIQSGWMGSVKLYNGLIELVPTSELTVDGTATCPEALIINTASEVNETNLNRKISISKVRFEDSTPNKRAASFNGTLLEDDGTVVFYNAFKLAGVPAGDYSIEGFVSVHNGTYQVYPTVYNPLSGIENVSVANKDVPVVYYNLQGVRIDRPSKGCVVVEVRNGKANKTMR